MQDFPYYLEPGIAHMNLWANRPLAPSEVEAAAAERVSAAPLQHSWGCRPFCPARKR